jgi:hypothetical protein
MGATRRAARPDNRPNGRFKSANILFRWTEQRLRRLPSILIWSDQSMSVLHRYMAEISSKLTLRYFLHKILLDQEPVSDILILLPLTVTTTARHCARLQSLADITPHTSRLK